MSNVLLSNAEVDDRAHPSGPSSSPRLVGMDLKVPLVTGEATRYVNLDYAASTPALADVADAVQGFLPWYSSVHRGTGFASVVSTEAYERARKAVASFVSARPDMVVVLVRNTTEATNVLAQALPDDVPVVFFASEHHANLLPWGRREHRRLAVPSSAGEMLEQLAGALASLAGAPSLVAVTGVSNVTGEIWPIEEIAALAHGRGARLFVDAAQLVPHVPLDMAALGVDYAAFSGHKMYAPFGAGALVGWSDWLEQRAPLLQGGGAVRQVREDYVAWADAPARHEAGSPNVVGAVALAAACRALEAFDRLGLVEGEAHLYAHARARLAAIPGLRFHDLWGPDWPHVGVLTFNVAGQHPGLLAAALGAEHGVGVRYGSFCAHLLMAHLAEQVEETPLTAGLFPGCAPDVAGAVRLSFGLGSSREDVDLAVDALAAIVRDGPRWDYAYDSQRNEFFPRPDPRPLPVGILPGA